jgi:four helix bundle protein
MGKPFLEYPFKEQIMSSIRRFEDLIAWQKVRELTRSNYDIMRQEGFTGDRGLAGQVQRASVSVMSNVAEGFERGGAEEFHRFLTIAKGSFAEVRCQLYVALDTGYLIRTDFDRLMAQAEEVGRVTLRPDDLSSPQTEPAPLMSTS